MARGRMGHLNTVLARQLVPLASRAPLTSLASGAGRAGPVGNFARNSRPESVPSGGPLDGAPDDTRHWQVFGIPYVSSAVNHDEDYTDNSAGFVMGGTRRFTEQFAVGLHLGYSGGRSRGDLMDMDNTARSGLLGLHAVFNVTPEWYLRGQFTGFLARYHQDYQTGLAENPLSASADFNGRGLYAALNTGRVWHIDGSNTLTPEIGLSWLWSHQDDFSLDWRYAAGNAAPTYAMDFAEQDYRALDGTAMLRWRGNFVPGDGSGGALRPALGLGLRQRLNDEDVESTVRFAGASFSTRVSEDRTTALAEAGLEWQMGGFSLGLAYTGEYGAWQEVHTGWLTMKYEF